MSEPRDAPIHGIPRKEKKPEYEPLEIIDGATPVPAPETRDTPRGEVSRPNIEHPAEGRQVIQDKLRGPPKGTIGIDIHPDHEAAQTAVIDTLRQNKKPLRIIAGAQNVPAKNPPAPQTWTISRPQITPIGGSHTLNPETGEPTHAPGQWGHPQKPNPKVKPHENKK